MAETERPRRRWFHHLIALWITFHLFAVTVHLIPVPPRTDDAALEIPEVKKEIDRTVDLLYGTGLYGGSKEELREDGIAAVRAYTKQHKDLTWFARYYLGRIGSTQTWNMFGGNAKEWPQVMLVEVRPRGEPEWELFQDGRWGGDVIDHRHRKVRRVLSVRGRTRQRREYAAFLAKEWDALHPDRPAGQIKLYYVQQHTRTPAQVRAGEPLQTKRTQTFVHTVVEGEQ